VARQVPVTVVPPSAELSEQELLATLPLHASIWTWAGAQMSVPEAEVSATIALESAAEVVDDESASLVWLQANTVANMATAQVLATAMTELRVVGFVSFVMPMGRRLAQSSSWVSLRWSNVARVASGTDIDLLIEQAQEGDVHAFQTLLAEHLPRVRRFARGFAGSDSDADDLAQEALIKVYKSLRLFRYQSAFSTWLYAVVRNVFLDATKSRAGRERSREESLQPGHTRDLLGGAPADERLDREEERERLWQALRQVPPEFRTALVLFDIEGRTYDEVAAIENVPVGTVKSRLSRGRSHLRRLLGEGEEGERPVAAAEAGTPAVLPSSHLPRRGS
jgi:RNA polymerase sigma-70 factor (ECF subfamily)